MPSITCKYSWGQFYQNGGPIRENMVLLFFVRYVFIILSKLKAWSTAMPPMAQPVETTTILNAQPFWTLLEVSTLWCLFKSIADLCFTGPFAVLGKAKYQYRPLHAGRKMFRCEEAWYEYMIYHNWTLTYNPTLAKVKVDPHARNQGHRSNDSNRRAQTNGHTNKKTLINVYMDGCPPLKSNSGYTGGYGMVRL